MNPFDKAIETVKYLGDTSAASGMAKLILTFYNETHPFSFNECTRSFDNDNMALAVQMIDYYATHGEDASVIRAGEVIKEKWPHLMELSKAGSQAKADVLRKWREALTEDDLDN